MVALPPVAPAVGLTHRVRLGRDYYVRIDTNDYSVDPRVIGRFVDVHADPDPGRGRPAPGRSWPATTGAGPRTAHDHRPAHQATAKALRADLAAPRERAAPQRPRSHADGHVVAMRALPDYDALFGVDFDPHPDRPGPSPRQPLKGRNDAPRHQDHDQPRRRPGRRAAARSWPT